MTCGYEWVNASNFSRSIWYTNEVDQEYCN